MKTTQTETGSIKTWYDRQTRQYVTQTLDKDDNQIGNADYDGSKAGAAISHKWRVENP